MDFPVVLIMGQLFSPCSLTVSFLLREGRGCLAGGQRGGDRFIWACVVITLGIALVLRGRIKPKAWLSLGACVT